MEKIVSLLSKAHGDKEINALLSDLLTPNEVSDLEVRLEIMQKLSSGMTQREVSNAMGVSITTVNRCAKAMNYGTGAMKLAMMKQQSKAGPLEKIMTKVTA